MTTTTLPSFQHSVFMAPSHALSDEASAETDPGAEAAENQEPIAHPAFEFRLND